MESREQQISREIRRYIKKINFDQFYGHINITTVRGPV